VPMSRPSAVVVSFHFHTAGDKVSIMPSTFIRRGPHSEDGASHVSPTQPLDVPASPMTQDGTYRMRKAARRALLLGVDSFEDAALKHLRSPSTDVVALERVLADPSIGDFDVQSVVNSPSMAMREAIETFFSILRPKTSFCSIYPVMALRTSQDNCTLLPRIPNSLEYRQLPSLRHLSLGQWTEPDRALLS
jgi:hypothetical protein